MIAVPLERTNTAREATTYRVDLLTVTWQVYRHQRSESLLIRGTLTMSQIHYLKVLINRFDCCYCCLSLADSDEWPNGTGCHGVCSGDASTAGQTLSFTAEWRIGQERSCILFYHCAKGIC